MNDSVINWLLEENEPSIRYKTLTELLDYPSDHDGKLFVIGGRIVQERH